MKVMQNKKIKQAPMGVLIASLVQLGICGINIKFFGFITFLLACYLGYVFIKQRKDVIDWLKIEHLLMVVILIEILFGCSLIYLFDNII